MIDYCLVSITYALKLLVIKDIFNELGLPENTFDPAAFIFCKTKGSQTQVRYYYVRMQSRVCITKQECHIYIQDGKQSTIKRPYTTIKRP